MNRYAKLAVALVITCIAGIATAQVPQSPAPAPAASSAVAPVIAIASNKATHALTGADLETFLDGMVPYALKRGDIAGGVISVVKDGKVLFAKGYGYADLETRQRPSPETTLFRIGSTSKLFTWTAVMQLVQQGKLDLGADVNRYLDFRIPPRDGKPVTLHDLMTMTPGFEDTARNLFPASADDIDLGRYLKTHIPARIFPPGQVVSYSNYGCGLAGYIVQRVSGEAFDDYIREHIFEPLGMHHSSFAQPLPASLAPLMAKGYETASDAEPHPFELVDPAPAGAMSTTAMDMTRFMIAQLQNGRFGDVRILQEKTAELMHSPQHTEAPGLNGYALGFYQENRNGQRIIGHGGDTMVFHTDLHLLLDADVGVFMSFNSAGDAGAVEMIRTAIFRAFLDRYFPQTPSVQPTASTAATDAARVAGWYESSRRNDSALRLVYMLDQTRVTAHPNGTVSVLMPMMNNAAGKPLRWRETGPLHYTEAVNGKASLDFVADKQGRILYWATDALPPVMIFQRVSTARSRGVVGPMIVLVSLVALATLLVWFIGWWVRRHFRRPLELTRKQRFARLLSRLGALALIAVLVGWLAFLGVMTGNVALLLEGAAVPWMYVLYVLGVLALLGALAIIANTVRVWLAPRRGAWVRAGETLLGLAALYAIWFIVVFGLVSFNVHY